MRTINPASFHPRKVNTPGFLTTVKWGILKRKMNRHESIENHSSIAPQLLDIDDKSDAEAEAEQ